MNHQHSRVVLRVVELSLALVAGVLAWLWLRHVIWDAEPWNWQEYGPNEPYPDWFIYARQNLLNFAWFVATAVALSMISLVRGFYGDTRHLSRLGYFVLAWPLVHFLPLSLFGCYGVFLFPIGFVLALIAVGESLVRKRNYGNLIAVPLSFAWVVLALVYSGMLESLIGD